MVLREVPAENMARPLGRNEVIGLLFRLTIFGAVTYFTIKWMVDAIDPTRKQKVEAQKQVRLGLGGHLHLYLYLNLSSVHHDHQDHQVQTSLSCSIRELVPVQCSADAGVCGRAYQDQLKLIDHLYLSSLCLLPVSGGEANASDWREEREAV